MSYMPTGLNPQSPFKPYSEMLILGGMVIVGMFGSQLLSVLIAVQFFGVDVDKLFYAINNPDALQDKDRTLILLMQGVATFFSFVLPPLILVYFIRKESLWSFSPRPIVDNIQLFWTIALIPSLIPLMELIITWNKHVDLPEVFAAWEAQALAKEQQLGEITEFITAYSSFGQFLIGLIVIAVLPALGEELLFRGTLQPMLQKILGSHHRAIWVTAFIFSAIHLQFYGFLPRMLLGALFGYLYYWSGNISIPILTHFVNNGLSVVLAYMSQQGNTSLDPDKLPEAPLYVLVLSAIVGVAVLYRFYMRYFVAYLPKNP